MEIGTVIRKYRKDKEMTQEQLARLLGVSAPAVNKWENGNAYPDITLLSPLARALGTTVDTLLSFRENLEEKEVYEMLEKLVPAVKESGFDTAFEMAESWIREYPGCELLCLNMAQMLNGCTMLYGCEPSEEQKEKIMSWYRTAAASRDKKTAEGAVSQLISDCIRKENYTEAQELLDGLPEPGYDKRLMQIRVLEAEKKYGEAYRETEQYLYGAANEIYTILNMLTDLACAEEDYEAASSYAETAEAHARLLQLWGYTYKTLKFQVASIKKEKKEALDALEAMFTALGQPWDLQDHFLYRHMKTKENSSDFMQQMKEMLINSMKQSEDLAFLRGDERFERLIG